MIGTPVSLVSLDYRLKELSEQITQAVDLAELRSSFHPDREAWWWFFEPSKTPTWWDRNDRLWNFLSVLLLTCSVYLTLEISTQLLKGESDTVGSAVATFQTILTTIFAGLILTKDGQATVDRMFAYLNVPINQRQEGGLFLSGILLLFILGFKISLPFISEYYSKAGFIDYESGRLSSAEVNYNRAIKFDPDNSEAHFRLGNIAEQLDEVDRALKSYRLSTKGGYITAFNNLGRLYILQGNYDKATTFLEQGLAQEKDPEVKYFLLKNLGWARLKQERASEAQIYLEEAITLKNDIASAHCLLAETLEARDDKDAIEHWKDCLAYADKFDPDEDRWIGEAQKRVTLTTP